MGGWGVHVELQFNTGIQRLMIPAIAGGGFHIRLEVRVGDAHHGQGQRIAGAAGHRLKEEGEALILLCGEAVTILILRCGIVHLVGLGLAVQKQEKSNGIHLAGEGKSVVQPKFTAVIEEWQTLPTLGEISRSSFVGEHCQKFGILLRRLKRVCGDSL